VPDRVLEVQSLALQIAPVRQQQSQPVTSHRYGVANPHTNQITAPSSG
jgi:hypothetical protein